MLELADQGKLSLDDKIDKYVPDVPNGAVITLRDLLAMRSGLYEYAEDPTMFGPYQEDPLLPDMLAYAPQLTTGAGLDPATWQARQAWNPITTTGIKVDYGLGLTRFGDWFGHDGSIYGYSDVVVHRPESDTSIVIMVNGGDGAEVPSVPPFVEIARLLYPDSLATY